MMSPIQYVLTCVHKYPGLFSKDNFMESKRAVYDHLFNVLGNGIRDIKAFRKEMNKPFDETVDYSKYVNPEKLYCGYTQISADISKVLKREWPEMSSQIPGLYRESELEHIAEIHGVKLWMDFDELKMLGTSNNAQTKAPQWVPYPNFKKEYSIVWSSGFKKMGIEWIDAAIEYYSMARNYFERDCSGYSRYYPKATPALTAKDDADVLYRVQKPECFRDEDAVIAWFGVPFRGDIKKFQEDSWSHEFNRIKSFIDETLLSLNRMKLELEPVSNGPSME